MIYLSNAFSLQMISQYNATKISIKSINIKELVNKLSASKTDYKGFADKVIDFRDNKILVNAIGHADTNNVVKSLLELYGATVLGMEANRVNVALRPIDTLFVAQIVGGRLPEGATTLPVDFNMKFLKVEIVSPWKVDLLNSDKNVIKTLTFDNELTHSELISKVREMSNDIPHESIRAIPLEKTKDELQKLSSFTKQ